MRFWTTDRSYDDFFNRLERSEKSVCRMPHGGSPLGRGSALWSSRAHAVDHTRVVEALKMGSQPEGGRRRGLRARTHAGGRPVDLGWAVAYSTALPGRRRVAGRADRERGSGRYGGHRGGCSDVPDRRKNWFSVVKSK